MPIAVCVPPFLPPQSASVLAPSTRVPLTSNASGSSASPSNNISQSSSRTKSDFSNYRARYYPPGYDPVKSKRAKKRPFGLFDVPTFYPTKEEFENPLEYVAKIREIGQRFGAVKVVPPRSWKPEFSLPVDVGIEFADCHIRAKLIIALFLPPLRPSSNLGICSVLSSACGLQISTQKFRFATRLQRLNHMNGRTRAAVSYLDALGTFHSQTGRQLSKLPNINGRTVDMWRLKLAVEAAGGYDNVCDSKEWPAMARAINLGEFPLSATQNIAYAVKKAYEAWILPYEASLGRGRTLDENGRPTVVRQMSQTDANSPNGRKTKTSLRALSHSDDEDEDDDENLGSDTETVKRSARTNSGSSVEPSRTGSTKSRSSAGEETGETKRKRADDEDINIGDSEVDSEAKRRKLNAPGKVPATPAAKPMSAEDLKVCCDAFSLLVVISSSKTKLVQGLCQVCLRQTLTPNPPSIKCDGCELPYHLNCLLIRPRRDIEEWWCPKCLDLSGEDFGFDEGGTYTLSEFKDKCEKWKRAYFGLKEPQRAWEGGVWTEAPVEGAKGRGGVTEEDVETEFWNLVEDPYNGVEVEYGADLHTSVYGSRNIPGMMVPWIYVGSAFSTFCWHVEDHWSYAINYNWIGETKTWYVIPERGAEKFEEVMRATVPELFEKTPDLLFHITTMLSPGLLQEKGVPVFAADQRPGEFIITWPRAYHSGFNHGFNIAEAVNFATPDWLEMGNKCVERYRECKRAPVYSHDEMVIRIARGLKGVGKDGKTMDVQEEAPIDAKTIEWLLPALTALYHRETSARAVLRRLYLNLTVTSLDVAVSSAEPGSRNRNVSAMSNMSGDVVVLVPGGETAFRPDADEIECGECKSYCFLSAVRCGNDNCDRKYDERDADEEPEGKMGKMGPMAKTGSTKKKGMKAVAGGAARIEIYRDEDLSGPSTGEPEFKQDVRYGYDYSKTKRSLRYVCVGGDIAHAHSSATTRRAPVEARLKSVGDPTDTINQLLLKINDMSLSKLATNFDDDRQSNQISDAQISAVQRLPPLSTSLRSKHVSAASAARRLVRNRVSHDTKGDTRGDGPACSVRAVMRNISNTQRSDDRKAVDLARRSSIVGANRTAIPPSPAKRPRLDIRRVDTMDVTYSAPHLPPLHPLTVPRSVLPSPQRSASYLLTPPQSADAERPGVCMPFSWGVPSLKELDAEEEGDPCKVHEYAEDIVSYLRMMDDFAQPNPSYMRRQPHINFAMRSVLVDWLSEVCTQGGMVPETLLLAVSLLDRFLSETRCTVTADRFQLLGVACLLIAGKYEEVNPPKMAFLLNVCHNVYTRAQLKDAEVFILTTLYFDVSSFASPLNFLRRISRAEGYDPVTRTVGKYLVELCAADGDCVGEKSSVVAAACAWTARIMMDRIEWTEALVNHSGFSPENRDLLRVAGILRRHLELGVKAPSIRHKYSSPEYLAVSVKVDAWVRRSDGRWRS
ncbi:hypothetical protein HDU93_003463 [Gonapodya sp. JEL0774]|nr:hypothetical protein HDU93_003463 [Gonapodya sp. JEL0774]